MTCNCVKIIKEVEKDMKYTLDSAQKSRCSEWSSEAFQQKIGMQNLAAKIKQSKTIPCDCKEIARKELLYLRRLEKYDSETLLHELQGVYYLANELGADVSDEVEQSTIDKYALDGEKYKEAEKAICDQF